MSISAWSSEVCSSDHLALVKVGQFERAIGNPDEARNLQPHELQHPADLAVLAFGQLHLDPGVSPGPALHVRVDRPIAYAFDLDTVDQFLKLRLAHLAKDTGAIDALDP